MLKIDKKKEKNINYQILDNLMIYGELYLNMRQITMV